MAMKIPVVIFRLIKRRLLNYIRYMMSNCNGSGRKWSWLISMQCSGIRL